MDVRTYVSCQLNTIMHAHLSSHCPMVILISGVHAYL